MGIFKKLKKVVKKVGKVALPIAAAYGGSQLLGSAFGSVGGATSATSAADPPSTGPTNLPRVNIDASTPNWFSQNSGALLQGGLSFLGQAQANASNAKQAQSQMDFQREMSNTSYQRGTEDMQAAGLNPMLAYSQGGASSPGGASASIQDAITPGITSARAAQTQKLALEQLDLTNENLVKQNKNIEAQTGYTNAQANQVRSQTFGAELELERFREQVRNLRVNGDLTATQERQLLNIGPEQVRALKLGNQGATYDLAEKKAGHDFWSTTGEAGKALPFVSGAVNAAKTFKHLFGK